MSYTKDTLVQQTTVDYSEQQRKDWPAGLCFHLVSTKSFIWTDAKVSFGRTQGYTRHL